MTYHFLFSPARDGGRRARAGLCYGALACRFKFITNAALWEETEENVNAMASKLRLYDNFSGDGVCNKTKGSVFTSFKKIGLAVLSLSSRSLSSSRDIFKSNKSDDRTVSSG
eukprot:9478771-Pyramimonas_sp.AAC.1